MEKESDFSKIKRWEVWRRKGKTERKAQNDFVFLGASRAPRWWINEEMKLQRGNEVVVRAVFVDGGREAVSAAGRVEVEEVEEVEEVKEVE